MESSTWYSESTIDITQGATHYALSIIDYQTKKKTYLDIRMPEQTTEAQTKMSFWSLFLIIHHLFSRKKFYHHLSTLSEELKLQWKGLWKTNEHWTKAQFRARSRVFFAGTISSSAVRMTLSMAERRGGGGAHWARIIENIQ